MADTPIVAGDNPAIFALHESREFSLALIARLQQRLARAAGHLTGVRTIAAGGSLGRLEASPVSDLDCILILDDACSADDAAVRHTIDRVFAILAELDIKPPKPAGIYRTPVTAAALCDRKALGSLSEPPEIFGKRIQLLLDARPLYGDADFVTIRRSVLAWYATGFLEHDRHKQWTYLINDLSRYLHSYAAWQQFKFDHSDDDSWCLRQAKLRSSRILTIAGLLLLIGESSAMENDKLPWLEARLDATPLERVNAVFTRYAAADFAEILTPYAEIHALMSDPAVRAELVATGPRALADLPGDMAGAYQTIHRLSDQMISALNRFIFSRQQDWQQTFFNYLVF